MAIFFDFSNYIYSNIFSRKLENPLIESKFDDLYGFKKDRKKRKIYVENIELESAGLADKNKDYCAHHFLKLLACKRDNFPGIFICHGYRNILQDCLVEDYILRKKEYEREYRLHAREERIKRLERALE